MLFTSYGFIGLTAAVLVLYYTALKRYQWQLLLAASYAFYWFSGPKNLIFILVTTVTVFLAAQKISGLHQAQEAYLKEHKAQMSKAKLQRNTWTRTATMWF